MKAAAAPRVGIIGTGWGLQVQAPAFRAAGWQVTALCGRGKEKTAELAQKNDIPFYTCDPEELIRHENVDLVSVVYPPNAHAELSIAALKAGKHVLCDKPTALNAKEAELMFETAKSHPSQLSLIDHELRFLPSLRRARQVIQSKQLGAVKHVHCEFFSFMNVNPAWHWWWDRELGGGLMGAIASHIIDNVSWVLGHRAKAVNAHLRTLVKHRGDSSSAEQLGHEVTADDSGALHLRFEDDLCCDISLEMYATGAASKRKKECRFICEGGVLYFDIDSGVLEGYLNAMPGFKPSASLGEGLSHSDPFLRVDLNEEAGEGEEAKKKVEIPEAVSPNPFSYGTWRMALALRNALEEASSLEGAATFADGLYVQRVLDAARRSSDQGSVWVNIDL